MKKILFLAALLAIGLTQTGQSPELLSIKWFKKGFPGVVPLEGDYLYVDESEISNLQWKEYMSWLEGNNRSEHTQSYPDTLVWRSKMGYGEPFVHHYFQHPAYKDYPVIGVTYLQALAYCQWRSDRVNEYLALNNHPVHKVMYRLPSEEEWKKAAWGTIPEGSMWPWEGEGVRWEDGKKKHQGLIKLNYNRGIAYQQLSSPMNGMGFITTPVYSYWPNTIGIYNICGNVAEWVEERKALGGSWNDKGYHCQITTPKEILPDTYRSSTIGFRCVMEIVEFREEYKTQPHSWSVKNIEKQMRYIPRAEKKNLLFASETEVSNEQYITFLKETQYTQGRIQNENWLKHSRYKAQQLYGWHQAYAHYPVVNISYEDASKYCQWLTEKYNASAKRKYKKVIFRLPSIQEWERAASGGLTKPIYPWGGPFTRNSKGCYLANYHPLESQYFDTAYKFQSPFKASNHILIEEIVHDSTPYHLIYRYPNHNYGISQNQDGYRFPAATNSYFPNAYGMYCMAGNVAEMVVERGVSKGGHWNSSQYQIKINAKGLSYTKANCYTGFRVFMEVLEP